MSLSIYVKEEEEEANVSVYLSNEGEGRHHDKVSY